MHLGLHHQVAYPVEHALQGAGVLEVAARSPRLAGQIPLTALELFAEDRFHPNAAAYHVLAAYFADTLATTKPKREGDRA